MIFFCSSTVHRSARTTDKHNFFFSRTLHSAVLPAATCARDSVCVCLCVSLFVVCFINRIPELMAICFAHFLLAGVQFARLPRVCTSTTKVCSFTVFLAISLCRSQLVVDSRRCTVRLVRAWVRRHRDGHTAKFINLSRNGNIIIHSRDMPNGPWTKGNTSSSDFCCACAAIIFFLSSLWQRVARTEQTVWSIDSEWGGEMNALFHPERTSSCKTYQLFWRHDENHAINLFGDGSIPCMQPKLTSAKCYIIEHLFIELSFDLSVFMIDRLRSGSKQHTKHIYRHSRLRTRFAHLSYEMSWCEGRKRMQNQKWCNRNENSRPHTYTHRIFDSNGTHSGKPKIR